MATTTKQAKKKAAGTGRSPKSAGVHLAQVATSFIEDAIREGRYAPGHRLVEADLARDTGLGIGPVREALRLLAGEGVIELIPFKGARIRRLERQDLIAILQVLKGLGYAGLHLVAELVAQRQRDTAEIDRAMDVIRASARRTNAATFMMRVGDFHSVLHALSGNEYLDKVSRTLHLNLFHRELAVFLPIEDWDGYVAAYERIAAALVAGDGDTAVAAFLRHMDRLIARLRAGAEF